MTSLNSLLRGTIAAIGLIALTTAAQAAEIYSTFGPGTGYVNGTGWTVSGPTSAATPSQSVAASFIVAQNYSLSSVDYAAFHVRGANSFVFSILSDNGGVPTGSLLFSTTTPVNPGTQSFAATGSLLAGNTYWLVMEPGNSNTWGAWNWSTSGIMGASFQSNGGAWTSSTVNPAPAFRINGTLNSTALTPEVPAGVQAIPVLLAVGGMALYQRKKKASSIGL